MVKFFNLPLEMLIEIFSRLPAKSVGKCRCVAKPWRTLLYTPQFIGSHLNRRRDQENLIITTLSHSAYSITDDAVSRKLEFPNLFSTNEFPNLFSKVYGSCNGLVLLENENDVYDLLVNPVTLRQVRIPDNPLPWKRGVGDFYTTYGFGYDRFSDDYKVVEIAFQHINVQYVDSVHTMVDVYSVKRGIWKRVQNSAYKYSFCSPYYDYGAFVNGAIHWLACRFHPGYPYVIAAFNLAHEAFDEVPAPVDVEVSMMADRLAVLGGCLCVYNSRSCSKMDFWVMKEYGVRESWTKFSINVADYQWNFVKPLHFIGDEDVVLLSGGGSLVVYNLKERTLRDLFVDGVVDGATFVESLVFPLEEAC